jgi:hypothetical protein
MAGLRLATHDVLDGPQQQVKTCCHKLAKFCTCPPDAPAMCPICDHPESKGAHYPEIDCRKAYGRPKK